MDNAKGQAEVAFAPGLKTSISLDSVRWAREVEPSRYPYKVKKIDAVFAAGDVAAFKIVLPASRNGNWHTQVKADLEQSPDVEGSLLSFDLPSGEVLALVGGYDFARSEFNRVTQATRQAGSSFKPFVYAAAVLQGNYTPASILVDPACYLPRPLLWLCLATRKLQPPFSWEAHTA